MNTVREIKATLLERSMNMKAPAFARAILYVLPVLMASCNGGGPAPVGTDGYQTSPIPVQPSFAISTSPNTTQTSPQVVRVGTTGAKITVGPVSQNGFSGMVNFSLTGVPTGFSIAPLNWSSRTGQTQEVAISLTSTAPSGPARIVIAGNSGALMSSTELFVRVESVVNQEVGPAGGTIGVADPTSPLFGVELNIPAGALSENVRIEINEDNTVPVPVNVIAVGPGIQFRPAGLTFRRPASLTIPYVDRDSDGLIDDPHNTGVEPEFLNLYSFSSSTQAWSSSSAAVSSSTPTVRGEIWHFSVYRLFFGRVRSNSTINYTFGALPTNRTSGLTDDDVKIAVRRAWATWQSELNHSGITVVEVIDVNAADVIIRWGDDLQFPILSLLNFDAVAIRNRPLSISLGRQVQIVFYDSLKLFNLDGSFSVFSWTDDVNKLIATVNIEATALHELGHVLGLGHPCNCSERRPSPGYAPAVMNAVGEFNEPLFSLMRRDVQAYRDLYGLVYSESGMAATSILYLVDPIGGGLDSSIGTIKTVSGAQPTITDIALLPRKFISNGDCCLLFGISFDALYVIDILTAVATPVGPSLGTTGVNALTFDGDANLFAASTSGLLVKIDPVSGAASHVGLLGSNFVSSGDLQFFGFFGLERLFATARGSLVNDVLVTVNPQTGSASPVGTNTDLGFQFVFGLAFASTVGSPGGLPLSFVNRELFGLTADGKLIRIDPRNGTASLVRNLSFTAFGGSN